MRSHAIGLGVLAIFGVALGACSASDDSGGDGGASGGGSGGGINVGGAGGGLNVGGSGAGTNSGGGAGTGGSAGCTQSVDIVFVMDVSTSMDVFLNKLATEIPAVDSAVKGLNLSGTPHYGLVVFVDDTMFTNSSQPYSDVSILQADFKSWATFTSSNQQVQAGGSNSTWPENSMDALHRAATEFPWRPIDQTLRIVIHTTDDTFWNGPTTGNGVPIQHGYNDTVTALQQAQVRVFSFASLLGGPFENEDVSGGWFGPYQGQKSIPESTGGGVFKLDDVLTGAKSLSESIPASVSGSLCKPYPTPR